MLNSEHEVSEQFDDARHVEHDTSDMYFKIYKTCFLLSREESSYFFSFVFLLNIEVT